ncbi:hypothetical protein DY000_02054215 [Brassica cretica]|uniref:Uncharacterized protein n=1 Tax=Brassica cretica TaxID=69181 RepID=A0ABQ7AI56_BRACR|nr:hypothetical protein DY000_02054215 [Brassica cretica]
MFAGENKSCERQRRVVLKSSRTNLAAQDTVFLKPLSSVSPYATSRIISEYLHNSGATICPPPPSSLKRIVSGGSSVRQQSLSSF